jgi:hypothetical protein
MPGPSGFRLEVRRADDATVYEFTEAETGRLLGSARDEPPPPERPSRVGSFLKAVSDSRWFRWLAVPIGLILVVGWLIAVILGLAKPPGRRKPGLCVRRPESGEPLFEIRSSPGLFYDSRLVSDGEGRSVARFQAPFKTALGRSGFGIIDLGETAGPVPAEGPRPWLGRVAPDGTGAYRFDLVTVRAAGRIAEGRPRLDGDPAAPYDIEAGPGLKNDSTGRLLLLAAALALAWRPPPG